MKRDRNSFSGAPNQQQIPTPYMQQPNPYMQQQPNMPGFQGYGPNMIPAQMGQYGYIDDDSNLEARVTRLERQIRKMESRISKIESKADLISDEDDMSSTNMLMI